MSIIIIIGKLGSGKTAFMTSLVKDYYDEGYTIYSNYSLSTIPYTEINQSNFNELIDRSKTRNIVCIDELVQNIKTRTINSIDIEIVVSQIRKFITERSHLIFTIQLFNQIPPDLLQLSDLLIKCYTIRNEAGDYEESIIEFYTFNEMTYNIELYDRYNVNLSYIFGQYDTYEDVKPLTKDYSKILKKYLDLGIKLSKKELSGLILRNQDAKSISEAGRIADMVSAERKIQNAN